MSKSEPTDYNILVAVGDAKQLEILLAVAVPLARAKGGRVTPLYIGSERRAPDWLVIDTAIQDVVSPPEITTGRTVARAVLDYVEQAKPDLLFLYWRGQSSRGRYLLGRTLDPLIQYAPCDVAVVRVMESPEEFVERMAGIQNIVVPVGGGPNAQLALSLALDMGPEATVTALRVAPKTLGHAAEAAQRQILAGALDELDDATRVQPRIELAAGVLDGIRQATAQDCDLVLLGATRDSMVDRLLFGNLPQQIVQQIALPMIIIRRRDASPAGAWRRMTWRVVNALPQLTVDERTGIYRQVRSGARSDADFYLMMLLATSIASFGLLLNSPAVIIGAMLMAPLMSALIGASLAVVQGDAWLLRTSVRTVFLGTLVVLGVSAVIGALVPGQRITAEMLGRSTPSLLDLAVALASGAAAAYANSRKDVASALPGVAIAVALVPPLATVGLALTEGSYAVALGALLMFAVNLIAIVSAASAVFLWVGFHPNTGEKRRARIFRGGVLGTVALLVAITGVLAVLGMRSIRYSLLNDRAERALVEHLSVLGADATLAAWRIAPTRNGVQVWADIHSAQPPTQEQALRLQEALAVVLNRPVALELVLSPVIRLDAVAPANATPQ